jgi:hypothetical protein
MFLRGHCGFFFRFHFGSGSKPERADKVMSDWIDQLKKKDEESASAKALAEQARLRKEDLIKAKAPAFWSTIMDQVQADSEKMNATFPDDDKRDRNSCARAMLLLRCQIVSGPADCFVPN